MKKQLRFAPLASEDACVLIPQALVLAKKEANLTWAHTNVTSWHISVLSDVPLQLGHEGLAKPAMQKKVVSVVCSQRLPCLCLAAFPRKLTADKPVSSCAAWNPRSHSGNMKVALQGQAAAVVCCLTPF